MSYEQAIGLAASSIVAILALQNIAQRNTYVICLVAIVWYWTSAEWAAVTKDILHELQHAVLYPSTSIWLTFLPQVFSFVLVQILALIAGVDICKGMCFIRASCSVGFGTWHLAGSAYFFGQLFTVAALALDAPSVVFVVKAIEPLTTALLAIPLLNQIFNLRLFLAILVACTGIMITAMAAHGGFNQIHHSRAEMSIVLSMLANVGFSSRACVAKRALAFESKEPLEAYGKLTVTATQSGFGLLLLWLFLAQSVLDERDMMSLLRHLSFNPGAWFTVCLTYFLYQACSIYLLSCFLVETHALLVALKHIFVVILASLLTGAVFNVHMTIGLSLVVAGVSWYLSSPASEDDAEKESILPTKDTKAVSEASSESVREVQQVSSWLIAVVASVVVLGTVLPLWRL